MMSPVKMAIFIDATDERFFLLRLIILKLQEGRVLEARGDILILMQLMKDEKSSAEIKEIVTFVKIVLDLAIKRKPEKYTTAESLYYKEIFADLKHINLNIYPGVTKIFFSSKEDKKFYEKSLHKNFNTKNLGGNYENYYDEDGFYLDLSILTEGMAANLVANFNRFMPSSEWTKFLLYTYSGANYGYKLLNGADESLTFLGTKALNGFSNIISYQGKSDFLKVFCTVFAKNYNFLAKVIFIDAAILDYLDSLNEQNALQILWKDLAKIHSNCTQVLLNNEYYPTHIPEEIPIIDGIREYLYKKITEDCVEIEVNGALENLIFLFAELNENNWVDFIIRCANSSRSFDISDLLKQKYIANVENIGKLLKVNAAAVVIHCCSKAEFLTQKISDSWLLPSIWEKVLETEIHPLYKLAKAFAEHKNYFSALACYTLYLEVSKVATLFSNSSLQIRGLIETLKRNALVKIQDSLKYFDDLAIKINQSTMLTTKEMDRFLFRLENFHQFLTISSATELNTLYLETKKFEDVLGRKYVDEMKLLNFDDLMIIKEYCKKDIGHLDQYFNEYLDKIPKIKEILPENFGNEDSEEFEVLESCAY